MRHNDNQSTLLTSANGPGGNPASVLFDMEQTEAYEEVMISCSREGDAERAKTLLQRCPTLDINVRDRRNGYTPLMWAASRGHIKMIEVLMSYGADQTLVNAQKQTALELAAPNVKKILLGNRINGQKVSNLRLLQAAWMSNYDEVHRLLDNRRKDVQVNCTNGDGLTPLLLLTRDLSFVERVSDSPSSFRPADVANVLLRSGAECHAVENQSGLTALHMACSGTSKQSVNLIQTLLKHGAGVMIRDKFGFTPLHCAAKVGNVSAIKILLQHSSNDVKIDVKGLAGSTPLHLAAMGGHEEAVKTLLKSGANSSCVDESGQTPIEMAKTRRIRYILQGKTPPVETTQPEIVQKKPVLAPVRTPSRLARAKSFGGLKDLHLPVASLGLGESTDVPRTPSDCSLDFWQHPFFMNAGAGCSTPGKGTRPGAISHLSMAELNASGPLAIAPSRPDSGVSHLGPRNSYFRRSTPARTNRSSIPVHLPPVITAKSPAPGTFSIRPEQLEFHRSESGDLMICGRGSTRTFVEDLEEGISMPSAMVSASPIMSSIALNDEFNIPDTITEADIESARSTRTRRSSIDKSADFLPSPVIQMPRRPLKALQSGKIRSVKFSESDDSGSPVVDVRSSLELGSPRLSDHRKHQRKISCPEVEVDPESRESQPSARSNNDVEVVDKTHVEGSVLKLSSSAPEIVLNDLKTGPGSRETTSMRSQGPQPAVVTKKNTMAKFKGSLVPPKPQRVAVKMSPLKGRSISLSDKQQKVDRLKKVASQPIPTTSESPKAASSSTFLKPVRPRIPSKERQSIEANETKQSSKQSTPTTSREELRTTEVPSNEPQQGTPNVQGRRKSDVSDPPPSVRLKTPLTASPAVKPVPSRKPVISKCRPNESNSRVSTKDNTRPVAVSQNKVIIPTASVKPANKRKVSAPSGKRRVPTGRKRGPAAESQSSSPPLPPPEEGTALISGIGWHVHTSANPDCHTVAPTYGSPRSAIFATKYPVIGKIGIPDDFESPDEKEQPLSHDPIDIATPRIPLIESTTDQTEQGFTDNDPTPRNQDLDDHRLTESAYDQETLLPGSDREGTLSPLPLKEFDELAEIEGPVFDDDDEELPFPASDSDGEHDESFIDLEADDDVASNADWNRRVEATNYLDLLRKCSHTDFVRGDRTAPTPVSASKRRPPPEPVADAQFEQSWHHDSLRSSVSHLTPADTLKSNVSEISSVDTIGALPQPGETMNWKRGNLLGRGAFGRVFCGMTARGELIAVKQIELSNDEGSKEEVRKIEDEIELLKTLEHRNIVQFFGTSRTNDTVNIFMEYLPGGSIASLLNRFGVFEERVFCRYTRQILDGVSFLHAMNIVHRDIKGANLMLMPNGRIKLIDFGCAKRLAQQTSQQQLQNSMQGSPYWMAPEVIHETGHGPKSDCWSIGCTVFEMATTKPPWAHMQPYAAIFAIGSGEGPIPSLNTDIFSPAACNFVARCLTRNPEQRPSAQELLKDPFVVKRSRSRKNTLTDDY